MILIIYAHPYPDQSRVNQQMLQRASSHPDVVIRSLYDLYPDFDIDVEAEQRASNSANCSSSNTRCIGTACRRC